MKITDGKITNRPLLTAISDSLFDGTQVVFKIEKPGGGTLEVKCIIYSIEYIVAEGKQRDTWAITGQYELPRTGRDTTKVKVPTSFRVSYNSNTKEGTFNTQ